MVLTKCTVLYLIMGHINEKFEGMVGKYTIIPISSISTDTSTCPQIHCTCKQKCIKVKYIMKSSIISFYHQKTSAPYEKNPCKYNTAHYRC